MAEGEPVQRSTMREKVAAAFGYIGLKNLDRVGGASFSSVFHSSANTWGADGNRYAGSFRFLAKLSCDGETNLESAAHSFTSLFPIPGLVVIISDLFDPAGWRAGHRRARDEKISDHHHSYPWTIRRSVPKLHGGCGAERRRKQSGSGDCFWTAIWFVASSRNDEIFQARSNQSFRVGGSLSPYHDSKVPFDDFVLQRCGK